MDSDSKTTTFVCGMLFTAICVVIFMISSCSHSDTLTNAPTEAFKAKAMYTLQLKCQQDRGEWVHENYRSYCKFK
jgi:hypothetical protein